MTALAATCAGLLTAGIALIALARHLNKTPKEH